MQKLLVVLALTALTFTSCGKKGGDDSPYTKDPSVPLVDISTDLPPAPTPTPTPTPTPDPHHPVPHPDPHHPVPPPPLAPPPQDHPTKYCSKAPGQHDYPNGPNISGGDRDGYQFGIGGGCIHRPIREVWATALNQSLMVWVDVDEATPLWYSPPGNTRYFINVNYKVHRFITVDWDMDWYHSLKDGTFEAPQKILINYKKVRGTSHIRYWEGSIILDRVNDNVTSFAMLNQIDADQNSNQDTMDAVKDVFNKLSTGAPDWGKLK